ncbi:hypothetical protein BC835DRAFT_1309999 [Cytidiella melzeri]|nr:hypothetical protein BC835DRAFT_1309999 [Cytidiella melzeri]
MASNANSKVVYKAGATSPASDFTTGAARTGSFIKLPPLTQVERDYLKANNGCFKCRYLSAARQQLLLQYSRRKQRGDWYHVKQCVFLQQGGNKGRVAAVEEVVDNNKDKTQTIAAI